MADSVQHVDFHPLLWMVDTSKLTNEERGVYSQVCAMIMHNGPFAIDEQHLANLCNCSTRKLRPLIQALYDKSFLKEVDGKVTQKRAEIELKRARKRIENSAKGGRTHAENDAESKENNKLGSTILNQTKPHHKEKGESNDSPKDKNTKRGTRWVKQGIPNAFYLYASGLGWDADTIKAVYEDFTDWWISKPGEGGVKLDWLATWQTWVRKEERKYGYAQKGISAPRNGAAGAGGGRRASRFDERAKGAADRINQHLRAAAASGTDGIPAADSGGIIESGDDVTTFER